MIEWTINRRTFLKAIGAAAAGALVPAALAELAEAGTEDLYLPGGWFATAEDVRLVEATLRDGLARGWGRLPDGEAIAAFGLTFLGTPYRAGDLDSSGRERLVIDVLGLNCVTFLEAAWALARAARRGGRSVRAFGRELEQIRYRDGRRAGYASRLHYYEDWLEDNAARGLLEPLTSALGGEPYLKTINYMSTHAEAYPVLARDPRALEAIRAREAELNTRARTFIPKARVAEIAGRLATGDILAITSDVPGLLISHTGMAYRRADGALHMLHAPNVGYPVQVTAEPLADYLAANEHQTGIMAARPV